MIRASVIIPCRNEGVALSRCLDAIDAQDLPRSRYEVIVVDGNSTDGCGAYAVARGHRLLQDPGRGPAAARNVGILAAKGDILAFTDADCVPRFDWLSRLVAGFDADPGVAGIAGGLRLPRETLLGRFEDNDARLHYRGYITSNVAYRRDVLLAVGGFDESLRCAEDYDLAWRILDAGHRIAHDLDALVQHEPPEVAGSTARYLRKQFWYARNDIPAHVLALRRSHRAPATLRGSRRAAAGLVSAAARASWAAIAVLGVARRSPRLLAGALGGAAAVSAREVSRAADGAAADRAPAEPARLAALQTAKLLVRGLGTLAGALDLSRPSAWRALRRAGAAWPAAAPAVAQAQATRSRAPRPA